jgi:phospholipase/carboxylesterase
MAIENFPEAEIERFHIVGFSQGAALGYAFGLYYPRRVLSLGGLSGFMPERAEALINAKRLENVPVFITHGTRDDLVPVEKARQAVRDFQRAGADVFYCEDEVGHKLSSTCFTSLEHFCALNVST